MATVELDLALIEELIEALTDTGDSDGTAVTLIHEGKACIHQGVGEFETYKRYRLGRVLSRRENLRAGRPAWSMAERAYRDKLNEAAQQNYEDGDEKIDEGLSILSDLKNRLIKALEASKCTT